MPTASILDYSGDILVPFYPEPDAPLFPVNLPASITYPKGTLLGELTGNNEIQSLIIDATGGTFTATFGGQTTAATAYNATAATMKTNLEALSTIGVGNVGVTKCRSRWSLALAAGTDGGSFGLRLTNAGVTQVVPNQAWNVSAANLQTAIRLLTGFGAATVALGSEIYTLVFAASMGDVLVEVVNDTTNDGGVWEQGIVVSETDLGSVFLIEFQNYLGNQNVAALTTTATSLTGGAGTATVATVTAGSAGTPGSFKAYLSTATDGSQVPKCFLQYPCATDSSGNITFGTVAGVSSHGETFKSAPAFFGGVFKTTDLKISGGAGSLDANAISVLNGAIISGTLNDGVFKF